MIGAATTEIEAVNAIGTDETVTPATDTEGIASAVETIGAEMTDGIERTTEEIATEVGTTDEIETEAVTTVVIVIDTVIVSGEIEDTQPKRLDYIASVTHRLTLA